MHVATQVVASVTLIVSSIALVWMGIQLQTISVLLKILAFDSTTSPPTSTDPFVIAGYAVFIWRITEQAWALERDCCKPGFVPVAPEIDGVYDSQVVRKAGIPKQKGQ
jgi:hypothetical protein